MAFRTTIKTITALGFCLGVCLSTQSSRAQDASGVLVNQNSAGILNFSQPESAIKAYQIDNFLSELYNNNLFNGSIAVVDRGNLIYHQAYGWANFAQKDTLSLDTPFHLASVSKQFTAMAIMILKEKGKLSYDDDICKYLPELPYGGVTIRNLLHHNSGLPDYLNANLPVLQFFPKKELITNDDLIKYFSVRKPKLLFKPGTQAAYCNTGYVFLASIVERVSGESFAHFLHHHIFQPLDMKSTFIYNSRNIETQISQDTVLVATDTLLEAYNELKVETTIKIQTRIKTVPKRRAYGYELSFPYPNGFELNDFHPYDGIAGEKSVCASTADLIKWDQALHNNALVSASTFKEAIRPSSVADHGHYKYGFGWKIFSDQPHKIFHAGLYAGFKTYIQRNLKDQTCIIVLSNRSIRGRVLAIADAIDDILEGRPYKGIKATKVEKSTLHTFKQKYWIDYAKR
ncbi:MAG: serine hydrolase domain-containing protein [Microscillaceae bacterium]|nr:serine hydrolase domain-containing protein [Microscillaceae bacterium]